MMLIEYCEDVVRRRLGEVGEELNVLGVSNEWNGWRS